jgi:nitroimidazol reductase NimA-like FMN-containing flavoprotein (pyridoxamine 5'-phosphate oxidase superfamily)
MRDHSGASCQVDSDSVICYGRARLLDDATKRTAALNAFNRRFRPEVPDRPLERVAPFMAVEIALAEMTGWREPGPTPHVLPYHL